MARQSIDATPGRLTQRTAQQQDIEQQVTVTGVDTSRQLLIVQTTSATGRTGEILLQSKDITFTNPNDPGISQIQEALTGAARTRAARSIEASRLRERAEPTPTEIQAQASLAPGVRRADVEIAPVTTARIGREPQKQVQELRPTPTFFATPPQPTAIQTFLETRDIFKTSEVAVQQFAPKEPSQLRLEQLRLESRADIIGIGVLQGGQFVRGGISSIVGIPAFGRALVTRPVETIISTPGAIIEPFRQGQVSFGLGAIAAPVGFGKGVGLLIGKGRTALAPKTILQKGRTEVIFVEKIPRAESISRFEAQIGTTLFDVEAGGITRLSGLKGRQAATITGVRVTTRGKKPQEAILQADTRTIVQPSPIIKDLAGFQTVGELIGKERTPFVARGIIKLSEAEVRPTTLQIIKRQKFAEVVGETDIFEQAKIKLPIPEEKGFAQVPFEPPARIRKGLGVAGVTITELRRDFPSDIGAGFVPRQRPPTKQVRPPVFEAVAEVTTQQRLGLEGAVKLFEKQVTPKGIVGPPRPTLIAKQARIQAGLVSKDIAVPQITRQRAIQTAVPKAAPITRQRLLQKTTPLKIQRQKVIPVQKTIPSLIQKVFTRAVSLPRMRQRIRTRTILRTVSRPPRTPVIFPIGFPQKGPSIITLPSFFMEEAPRIAKKRKEKKPRKRQLRFAPSLAAVLLGRTIPREPSPRLAVSGLEIRPVPLGPRKARRKKKDSSL